MTTPYLPLFAALMLVIVPSLLMGLWLRSLLRLGLGTAGLLSAAINVSTLSISLWLANQEEYQTHEQASALRLLFEQRLRSDEAPVFLLAVILTANLIIALFIKLYRASVLDKVTPEERSLGVVGFRAWLSPVNVVTIVCVAIGACLVVGEVDYVGFAILGLCMLLAYPLVNTVLHQSPSFAMQEPTSRLKAPYEERQRVLALVEAGKITAEDGAELLTALAQSQAASSNAAGAISGPRRIMLVGAGITLVGFFLPWFTLNLTQAMRDAVSGLQQNMPQFPGGPQPNFSFAPSAGGEANAMQVPIENSISHIEVRGGDVQHGLGWIMLAAGLGAACLPFLWTPIGMDSRQMRNAVFATLTIGSVLALYVLSGSFNAVTSIESGFVLAMVGYVVLWVGSVREYVTPTRGLHMALAS